MVKPSDKRFEMDKFYFMGIDELGDEFRAHGTPFLEEVHEFPKFEENEEMWQAYLAWETAMEERANREWQEIYGDECWIHLEKQQTYNYNRDWFF